MTSLKWPFFQSFSVALKIKKILPQPPTQQISIVIVRDLKKERWWHVITVTVRLNGSIFNVLALLKNQGDCGTAVKLKANNI